MNSTSFRLSVFAIVFATITLFQNAGVAESTDTRIRHAGAGTIFLFVIAAFFVAGLSLVKRHKRIQTELKEKFPTEEWRWNPKWATDRLKPTQGKALFVHWLFPVVFGAFSVPIIFEFKPNEWSFSGVIDIFTRDPFLTLFLLFPVVSIAMFGSAIYKTMQHRKFKNTYCDLITTPGVVGGSLKAIVWAGYKHDPNDSILLGLACYRTVTTGSGDDRRSTKKLVWKHEHTVDSASIGRQTNTEQTIIPVAIAIPRTSEPTTLGSANEPISWELDVSSEIPGIDFQATFDVPVLVTAESDNANVDPVEMNFNPEEPQYQPGILIQENADSLVFDAPAGRAVAMKIGFTIPVVIMTCIFIGFAFRAWSAATNDSGTPQNSERNFEIFDSMFGLMSHVIPLFALSFMILIFGLIALSLWFVHVRVIMQRDRITIVKSALRFERTQEIDPSDVRGTEVKSNMSSGEVHYFHVSLRLQGTKKVSLFGNIRRIQEGNDIAEKIESFLGLKTSH